MRIGVNLAFTHVAAWPGIIAMADELGIESAWIPDHFVLPETVVGGPQSDHETAIPPETPLYDCFAMLGHFAAVTERIRLGTNVYLAALRHPFTTARGFATVDHLSGGRIEMGVGAGWLGAEFEAAGTDFRRRGRMLDEALTTIRRLWSEEAIEHSGEFWRWGPVRFEPKPVQHPLPVSVGGVSTAALRRVARQGDGWIALPHETPATLAPQLEQLRAACDAEDRRDMPFVSVMTHRPPPVDELRQWEQAGVDRIICRPWQRSRTALDELRQFCDAYRGHLDEAEPVGQPAHRSSQGACTEG